LRRTIVQEPGRLYPVVGQLTGVLLCAIDGDAGIAAVLLDPRRGRDGASSRPASGRDAGSSPST
jgi:hypothetical protein